MSSLPTQQFLERLIASQLLDEAQLRQARGLLQNEVNLKRVAAGLVEFGALTRWQARQLLAGGSTRFFLGKYKLLKLIGTGAMGSVYKAFHPTMNRAVALKVMAREILRDKRSILRFQREIRTAALLDHPHIVRALDADRAHRHYFLVMEYIDGKDLRHWMKASPRLPVAWCCECIRQAAEGLQHAHEQGVVHRDLKPSNLIVVGKQLGPQPVVKLVDFGLARLAEEADQKLTRLGRTVGTVGYMAPEQVHHSDCDIRADIYSLGLVLFQLIAGRLPLQGKSDLESLKLRLDRDAPKLSEFRSEVSPELDRIVARMLARDPAQRWQTPAGLAAALVSCVNDHAGPEMEPPRGAAAKAETVTEMGTLDNTDSSLEIFLESLSGSEQRHVLAEGSPGTGRSWTSGLAAGAGWIRRLIGAERNR